MDERPGAVIAALTRTMKAVFPVAETHDIYMVNNPGNISCFLNKLDDDASLAKSRNL